MSVMEIQEIMAILPHRYPFQMVDRIIELNMETGRVVGIKNVTNNEPYFQGHFPGNPVMPGVLQMEAMAQVAGVRRLVICAPAPDGKVNPLVLLAALLLSIRQFTVYILTQRSWCISLSKQECTSSRELVSIGMSITQSGCTV